jgi:hypothetical protein
MLTTPNKLTKILSSVAVLGIATAIAAPAQASTLGWSNGTSDFFSQVVPANGDTFQTIFSPDSISLVSTATGVFNPEFALAPPPYTQNLTPAVGNFTYVSGTGGTGGSGQYALSSPLTFAFTNGATVTWATGTLFDYLFDTATSVEFEVAASQLLLPTITGIAEIPPYGVIDDIIQFGDSSSVDGGVYDAEVDVDIAVPEPASLLGLLAVGGLGLVSKLKKQK